MRRIGYPRLASRGILLSVILVGGCVERTLTINSSPPGALVYLNDVEIGRTPVTRDFTWYGDYSVTVREDGYQTLKTHQLILAPFYEFVPLDLFSELLPIHLHDKHEYGYLLQPPPLVDDQTLMNNATDLKGELESSRLPKTQPSAKLKKKSAQPRAAQTQPAR